MKPRTLEEEGSNAAGSLWASVPLRVEIVCLASTFIPAITLCHHRSAATGVRTLLPARHTYWHSLFWQLVVMGCEDTLCRLCVLFPPPLDQPCAIPGLQSTCSNIAQQAMRVSDGASKGLKGVRTEGLHGGVTEED